MNTKPKPRILVVEDNPVNLELLLDILEIGGYECSAAFEGTQAIEMAKKEHPDLILLDIQLPGMDGISVLETLRSMPETRDIKAVALTAYAMRGDGEMFLEKSFDGYLSKPVAVKELLEAVKEYLNPPD
jgi:two-component system, cell cycle response regulator DivK